MNRGKCRIPALFLALALLFVFTACGGENTAATMHLIKTEGKVQVDNADGKSVKITENLGLYSGYEVATLADSYGWIALDDAKLAKMDASSDVEIRKKDKLLELYVRSGGLFFDVTEPLAEDETMNIRTSNIMVGIRGTRGWVEVEDENLMCVYLLKGKVECTVFDEDGNVLASEIITAGQAARLVLDGGEASITTAEFDTGRLPDFVVKEIRDGEGGTNAALGGSGTDVPGNPSQQGNQQGNPLQGDAPAAYADVLAGIEGEILYTETLDFEADGSPELLALYFLENENGTGNPVVRASVWREGSEGASELDSVDCDFRSYDWTIISLVESGGRLFLRIHCKDIYESNGINLETGFETYSGSLAQRDGGRSDWKRVEWLRYSQGERKGYGITKYTEDGYADTWEWGHTADEYEAVRGKYHEVKVLACCPDGENLIVTPEPSETGEAYGLDLIAPYVGTYTDEYQGHANYQLIVKEDGSVSIQHMDGSTPDWLQGNGDVPESVHQRVDGAILVTIHENESYIICPAGKKPSVSDDSHHYGLGWEASDRDRIMYVFTTDDGMPTFQDLFVR